jgi:transposase
MADPDLARVASVYSVAAAEGHAPTQAVEKRFRTSRSTAGRWVAAARRAGLLEPVGRGESPRLNRKLVAVAQELGVDPEALREAVVRRANGELRVRSR